MPKVKKEKKEKKGKRSKRGVNIKSNYQKVIVKVNNGTSKKSDGNQGYNIPSSGHHTTLYVPTQNPILENRYEPIPKHTLEDILHPVHNKMSEFEKNLEKLKKQNDDESETINYLINYVLDDDEYKTVEHPFFMQEKIRRATEKAQKQYDLPSNPMIKGIRNPQMITEERRKNRLMMMLIS